MAMQDTTCFDAALREDYLPVIRDQLENGTILMNRIQRNERDVSGQNWKMVAHYGRNPGIGSRAEGGTLPTAGYQKYLNPTDDVKYHYGRIQISGKLYMWLGPPIKKLVGRMTFLNSVNILRYLPVLRTIPSEANYNFAYSSHV